MADKAPKELVAGPAEMVEAPKRAAVAESVAAACPWWLDEAPRLPPGKREPWWRGRFLVAPKKPKARR
jgi:hypothetical protein